MTARKYHVNSEGNPGLCSAQIGNCPFGGEDKHFSNKKEAMAHFEQSQKAGLLDISVQKEKKMGSSEIYAMDAGSQAFESLNRIVALSDLYSKRKDDFEGFQKAAELAYLRELEGASDSLKDEIFYAASSMAVSDNTSFIAPEYASVIKVVEIARDEEIRVGRVKRNDDVPVSGGHVLWRRMGKNLSEVETQEALISANFSEEDISTISKSELNAIFSISYDKLSTIGIQGVEEEYINFSKILKKIKNEKLESLPFVEDTQRFESMASEWTQNKIESKILALKKIRNGKDNELAQLADEEIEILETLGSKEI